MLRESGKKNIVNLCLGAGSRFYGFERTYEKQRVMIFLNMEEAKMTCSIPENAEILMQEGWKDNILDPYGYVVALVQE